MILYDSYRTACDGCTTRYFGCCDHNGNQVEVSKEAYEGAVGPTTKECCTGNETAPSGKLLWGPWIKAKKVPSHNSLLDRIKKFFGGTQKHRNFMPSEGLTTKDGLIIAGAVVGTAVVTALAIHFTKKATKS